MEFQLSTADASFQSDLRQFIDDEYVPEWELGERGSGARRHAAFSQSASA